MFQSMVRKTSYALASLTLASGIVVSHGYASPEPQQPAIEWSHQYGKDQLSSDGRSVTATPDGGYIVAGDIEENTGSGYGFPKAYILKVNASGKIEWDQRIQHETSDYTYAYKAVQTRDGGYIVSGATKSYDGKPHDAIFLAKLSAQGTVEWEKEYGDGYTDETGETVAETEDGGFVVTGNSVTSYGEAPAYVLKTDAQGQQLWYKEFRFGSNQYFNDIIATPDGGSIAVGTLNSIISTGEDDAAIVTKQNANGEEVWTKRLAQPNSKRNAYSIISSGEEYIIASRTQDDINYLTKINANGEVIWERTYDPTPDRELFNKVVQTDHGYALLGENRKGAYPQIESRFEVLKLGKNGEIVNNTIFGEPNLYSPGRGTASPDGGFVLTGQVNVSEKYILQLTKLSHSQDNPPVERTLTCIVFTDSTKKIAVGENAPATVNAHYSDGSEAGISDSVSFTSEDEDTATVDSKGLITGVKPGSTTINAVYKGLSAQLKVDVSESPGSGDPDPVEGSFYLDSDEYSLTAGTSLDTIAFFKDKDGKIHDVTKQSVFSSENAKIVDYDKDGNIIGVHAGITYITAEYQGKTYRALVQVVRASVPK